MQLSLSRVLIGSFMLLAINLIQAQNSNSFEGTISYSISFEGLPAEAAAMFATSEMKTYIKKEMLRTDMNMGFAKTITISDLKNQSYVILTEAMGQKIMSRKSPKDTLEKDNSTVPNIKYLNDVKEIAGYKCKKAEVTNIDNQGLPHTFSVYYTEELPYSDYQSQFQGLKGCLMEFEINESGMTMKISAKTVSKESISDDIFKIPEGYKEVSPEQMQMGGE